MTRVSDDLPGYTVPIDDFCLLLYKASNMLIHPYEVSFNLNSCPSELQTKIIDPKKLVLRTKGHSMSERIILSLAKRNITFEVNGQETPINAYYFIPPETPKEDENRKKMRQRVKNILDKYNQHIPSNEETKQIWLTRCCHLIKWDTVSLPSCPQCDQSQDPAAPFEITERQFAKLPFQEIPETVQLFSNCDISMKLVPQTSIICTLSKKTLLLEVDSNSLSRQSYEKNNDKDEWVGTPCSRVFHKETYLTHYNINNHCPHCKKEHEIDDSVLKNYATIRYLFNLTPEEENTLSKSEKEERKNERRTILNKEVKKVTPLTEKLMTKLGLQNSLVYCHQDESQVYPYSKEYQAVVFPRCHHHVKEEFWEKWKNNQIRNRGKIELIKDYFISGYPSIKCPCGCNKLIYPKEYLSRDELQEIQIKLLIRRICTISAISLSVFALALVCTFLHLQPSIIKSVFPSTTRGFEWSEEVLSYASWKVSNIAFSHIFGI